MHLKIVYYVHLIKKKIQFEKSQDPHSINVIKCNLLKLMSKCVSVSMTIMFMHLLSNWLCNLTANNQAHNYLLQTIEVDDDKHIYIYYRSKVTKTNVKSQPSYNISIMYLLIKILQIQINI